MDKLVLFTFAVYGLCFILMYGTIFNKLRNHLKESIHWFSDLITCPVCLGFWCGLSLSPFIFETTLLVPAAFYGSAVCYILHLITGVLLTKGDFTD